MHCTSKVHDTVYRKHPVNILYDILFETGIAFLIEYFLNTLHID